MRIVMPNDGRCTMLPDGIKGYALGMTGLS